MFAARGLLGYQLRRPGYADDLTEAVRLVPAAPPSPERAQVLEIWAHDYHHHPGYDKAEFLARAEEAVAAARAAGDAATEAEALATLASAEPLGGSVQRIRSLLAEARVAAARAHASQPPRRAAIIETDMLEGMGQHELAVAVAREEIATAREHGLARTYHGVILAINLAEPLASLGRWDEAAEVIDRAVQLFPARPGRSVLWRLSGDIALARGDLATAAEAVASIKAVLDAANPRDEDHLPLARLETEVHLGQGRLADALSTVEAALGRGDLLYSPRYAWPLLTAGARACAAAARDGALTARAAALHERLRGEAGGLQADGMLQQAHRLTFAAEAASQPGEVRAAWEAAARAWEEVGQPHALAAALLGSAEAALGEGDRDGAVTPLRRAAALALRLGARPLAGDIDLLARRARISPAGDADARAASPGPVGFPGQELGLTPREFEVLRLVAAGRSNRDIAAELFISAKTASVHVSNILGKLGVSGRGEAAARAHQFRLFA